MLISIDSSKQLARRKKRALFQHLQMDCDGCVSVCLHTLGISPRAVDSNKDFEYLSRNLHDDSRTDDSVQTNAAWIKARL